MQFVLHARCVLCVSWQITDDDDNNDNDDDDDDDDDEIGAACG